MSQQPKIQETERNYSEKVTQRFIELLIQNKLNICDELTILENILTKYELLTISEYATKNKLSDNGVKYKIERDLIPSIKLGNKQFIISAIC